MKPGTRLSAPPEGLALDPILAPFVTDARADAKAFSIRLPDQRDPGLISMRPI